MAYVNGGAITGIPTGAYPGDVPPPRMPMVALEMDRQEKALAYLHNIISDLENRLSAVTRAPGPDVAGANQNNRPVPVPLAGNLSEQNNKIEAACGRLQSIFERIEL